MATWTSLLKRWPQLGAVLVMVGGVAGLVRAADAPAPGVIASVDLSGGFGTRSAWHFTATEGPPVSDEFGSGGDTVPGLVTLCLRPDAVGACDPQIEGALRPPSGDDMFSEPHYLERAEIVRPRGASEQPLLLVQTASLHSGDGDQLVRVQVLAYAPASDRFVRVYGYTTGRNNNQEIRFVAAGPLKGDIISAEPTEDAPFGFWVTVSAFTPGAAYRQVLRYRSATRYADSNPLPVIDSEMPAIQGRLGLWRPGLPLPLPPGPCPAPHLIRMELWCG